MTPERWAQVTKLFEAALAQGAATRNVFLAEACAGDRDLQLAVEELLASFDNAGTFLEKPARELLVSGRAQSRVGRTLGEFVLHEELGRGGFSTVYRADQPLLAREAVVKVIEPRNGAQPEIIQRFLREVRLASKLDHPYAAHIYAFGAEPDATLWIAMEMVRGTTLDELLQLNGSVPLPRFVPLFDRVCEVVHTAHEQGIIHRDLKPGNVMVITRASQMLPKLLDFGIAKALCEPSTENELASLASLRVEQRLNPETTPLTHQGNVVGSPSYIAPEQWIDPTMVDSRSDIYALGVMAFECLTGHCPFVAESVGDVARQHMHEPPPSLGPEFPQALNPVLAKAMAKDPKDRFSTALEFGAALRAASGSGLEPEQIPQLDESLRETLVSHAPQPLAEAVAALEAARTLRHAFDSLVQLNRLVSRYLGTLALAARARIGPGAAKDHSNVLDCLRRLRTQELTDEGWLELARELCRAFAWKRDAHPVPELVSFFFEPGGDQPSSSSKQLELLQAALKDQCAETDEELRRCLAVAIAQLNRTLPGFSFLTDYPLVVGSGTGAEQWMGARRSRKLHRSIRSSALRKGEVAVLDREGFLVLSLWPLVQVIRPAPSRDEELFFLQGKGRYGAKLVSLPLGFERQDEELWDWFGRNLADLSHPDSSTGGVERAPYLGLLPFTAADADNFLGRERESQTFANRLRVQSLLAVVGPSGSGKTSFVQAGVIPLLPKNWQVILVRPGPTPLATLADRLSQKGIGSAELRHEFSTDPEALGKVLQSHIDAEVVVVVDQFEELLTLCCDPVERFRYAEILARAADREDGRVRVVLTLRDDFLIRAQQPPAFRDRLDYSLHLLGTPDRDDLLRIVTEPARRVGYAFDDPELPKEMVSAVAENPGALALLSFTAATLWEVRDRQLKELRRKAYQALGGVGGALARHAETTLLQMSPQEQQLAREAFRSLVTAEGTRAVLSRHELTQLLGSGESAERVLERLIGARLLVAYESVAGVDNIEVVHETLLTSWPTLVRWQREDAENARLRDQLRAAARQWEQRGRAKGVLWRGDALTEYRLWRSRFPGALTDSDSAFASASLREESRGRRLRRITGSIALVILCIGLAVLFRANKQARERIATLHEEQGRQLYLSGRPLQGLVFLSKAYEEGVRGAGIRYLIARASRIANTQLASLDAHTLSLNSAEFNHDGTLVVTASMDKTARIWDAKTGKLVATLLGHEDAINSAHFSPDASQIVTASMDHTARIWRVPSGRLIKVLNGHADRVYVAQFSPNGEYIVTGSSDKANVWDTKTGELLLSLEGDDQAFGFVAFSSDSQRIVTCSGILGRSRSSIAKVWDLRSGKLLTSLVGHAGKINRASVSPDGKLIATASNDTTAKIWTADSGKLFKSLEGHLGEVRDLAFSPDGAQLATASLDRTARVWAVKTGSLMSTLDGHHGGVQFVAYRPDGAQIVTSSDDATAILWESVSGTPSMTYIGHTGPVLSANFTRDGKRLVTASVDSSAKVWNAEMSWHALHFEAGKEAVGAGFSADGSRIRVATGRGDVSEWDSAVGTKLTSTHVGMFPAWDRSEARLLTMDPNNLSVGQVWDFQTKKLLTTLVGHKALAAGEFDLNGERVVTASQDSTAKIWNAQTGHLLRSLQGHSSGVSSAAFSPDGKRVVTASLDATVRVWDVDTGQSLLLLRQSAPVLSAAFSGDGKRIIATSLDATATIWDTEIGIPLVRLEGHSGPIVKAAFNTDETLIVTAGYDGFAKVWDAEGRLLENLPSKDRVEDAGFNSSGDRVVTLTRGGTVTVWESDLDYRTPEQVSSFVKCRMPFRLRGEQLFSEKPDCSLQN